MVWRAHRQLVRRTRSAVSSKRKAYPIPEPKQRTRARLAESASVLLTRNNLRFFPDNFGTVMQVAVAKRITSHAEAQRRRVSKHSAVVVSSASQRLCVRTYLAPAGGRAGKVLGHGLFHRQGLWVAASSPKDLGMVSSERDSRCQSPNQLDHPQSSVSLRFEAATRMP